MDVISKNARLLHEFLDINSCYEQEEGTDSGVQVETKIFPAERRLRNIEKITA